MRLQKPNTGERVTHRPTIEALRALIRRHTMKLPDDSSVPSSASSAGDAAGLVVAVLGVAAAATALAFAGQSWAGPAETLIEANKCSKCHTATTTKKGPSWADIAVKYKGKPDAEAKLVAMLKTGGADDHNKVVASDADLKAIVAVVLSSK
jgi:cytochrome c